MEQIIEIIALEDDYTSGFEVVTDKQRIKLSIENSQACCENWGYFWCNDNVHDFVGAELHNVRLTDTSLNEALMVSNGLNTDSRYFEGGVMFVNLETSNGVMQFVAYNEHNGYYGHSAKVQCTQIEHSEIL